MTLSQFKNEDAETVKSATATLRKARRRYSAAVARIRRVETFLEKHVDGLGYESRHLYGETEPFECPPRPVRVGLTRHLPQRYSLFFAKRAGEWHFYVAPTTELPEGGTLISSDEAIPLVNAPAEVVLFRVDMIERDAVDILEHLAIVVAVSSGDAAALVGSEATERKTVAQNVQKGAVH
jgi:hypothetical protein